VEAPSSWWGDDALVVGVADGFAGCPPGARRGGERAVPWKHGENLWAYACLGGQTLQVATLVGQREGDDGTGAARPGGTSGAVQIFLGPAWRVSVEDQTHLVDVDAARRDIGGHQYAERTILEGRQNSGPRTLREAAVQRSGQHPASA
jgi:hypothetical protein